MRKHRPINRPFFARDENYQFSVEVGSVIATGSYLVSMNTMKMMV